MLTQAMNESQSRRTDYLSYCPLSTCLQCLQNKYIIFDTPHLTAKINYMAMCAVQSVSGDICMYEALCAIPVNMMR